MSTDEQSGVKVAEPVRPIELVGKGPEDRTNVEAELEMSIFDGGVDFADSGKPIYTLTIAHGRYEFYGNALSADDLRHVMAEDAAIEADSKALTKLKGKELQEAGIAIAQRSAAKDLWVIERALIGWHHPDWTKPMPFTAENRAKVSKSVWAKVADAIVAKSWSGRARSDLATNF